MHRVVIFSNFVINITIMVVICAKKRIWSKIISTRLWCMDEVRLWRAPSKRFHDCIVNTTPACKEVADAIDRDLKILALPKGRGGGLVPSYVGRFDALSKTSKSEIDSQRFSTWPKIQNSTVIIQLHLDVWHTNAWSRKIKCEHYTEQLQQLFRLLN